MKRSSLSSDDDVAAAAPTAGVPVVLDEVEDLTLLNGESDDRHDEETALDFDILLVVDIVNVNVENEKTDEDDNNPRLIKSPPRTTTTNDDAPNLG
jgi:hypothetical protein